MRRGRRGSGPAPGLRVQHGYSVMQKKKTAPEPAGAGPKAPVPPP